ncbi:hypothetical protein PT974_02547 [Cladobotryum mycophilum]|uniref:F-box domain-containing protein n=1 Tax=Cladobotryum mycophilum TaxID=491253 RepID=A0ABR0SYH0_9HYPO
MAKWAELPPEIRLYVFRYLAENPNSLSGQRKAGFANYSLVSKEWQNFFERELYRRLRLQTECLDAFVNLVRPRRLIRHVWFCIELARYGCFQCNLLPGPGLAENDRGKVENAIIHLDSEHFFQKNMHYDADFHPMSEHMLPHAVIHDIPHGWYLGQQIEPPLCRQLLDYKGPCIRNLNKDCQVSKLLRVSFSVEPLDVGSGLELSVRWFIVSPSLSILPTSHGVNSSSHTSMNRVSHTVWFFCVEDSRLTLKGHRTLLLNGLVPSLKSISIFEDFNEDYIKIMAQSWGNALQTQALVQMWSWFPEKLRTPSRRTSSFLAERSLDLEKVSASYLVDAVYFFDYCQPH